MLTVKDVYYEFYESTCEKDLFKINLYDFYKNDDLYYKYINILLNNVSENKKHILEHILKVDRFDVLNNEVKLKKTGDMTFYSTVWEIFNPIYFYKYVEMCPVFDYCPTKVVDNIGPVDFKSLICSKNNDNPNNLKISLSIKVTAENIENSLDVCNIISFLGEVYKGNSELSLRYLDDFFTTVANYNASKYNNDCINKFLTTLVGKNDITNIKLNDVESNVIFMENLNKEFLKQANKIYVDTVMAPANTIFASYDDRLSIFKQFEEIYEIKCDCIIGKFFDFKIVFTKALPKNFCILAYVSNDLMRSSITNVIRIPSKIFSSVPLGESVWENSERIFTILNEDSLKFIMFKS